MQLQVFCGNPVTGMQLQVFCGNPVTGTQLQVFCGNAVTGMQLQVCSYRYAVTGIWNFFRMQLQVYGIFSV